ncbi:MAG: hypothetical protein UV51_C0017G0010 [Candidatus Woesebacteria bacterium GW2011_GWC1_42_9]|nr:MAG: hypothetical protein UV51_C0017G0010 [Candidatus Woesebacteria bacterium GW2011_GWC1_42_9]
MNLRGIIIGVGIFILAVFVAVYGISVFFPQPDYNAFCPEVRAAVIADTSGICENLGGKWTEYNFIKAPAKDEATGYCDLNYYCNLDYQKALEESNRMRFLVSIPVGIAVIVFGNAVFALETVGVGLMAGGAGTFVWGAGGYWSYASDVWRFVISLFGLVVLICFAYWFEKRIKKGFWQKVFLKK